MDYNIKTFRCFSTKLKNFLVNRGIRYITVALDCNTKKPFWLFIDDDRLSESLKIWESTKPSKM